MTCDETRPRLDAYFDSELDLAASLSVERHTAECAACAKTLSDLQALRSTLSAEAWNAFDDADLRPLRASIRRATAPPRRSWTKWPIAFLAAALVAAAIIPWTLHRGPTIERELVDSHVRSLMAEHLVDVPSSNRHTVKPWFQGKVDFAPDVPDLSGHGYELVGGRLDVLDGKQAAALVYRHGGHILNLWTVRASGADASPAYSTLDGYQVVHWRAGSLDHWLVSDMNAADVRSFISLFAAR
jgi:anti-sigma factor RsiW